MFKIEELTKEQKAKFPEFIDKWTKIGLCTDSANREKAEKAIVDCYILGGLKPPKKIVWCGSPLSQGITRAIVIQLIDKYSAKKISIEASVEASVWDSIEASVGDSVGDSIGDSVGASVRASVWDSVRASVGASVGASVWDSVGDSVGTSIRDSVGASVRASVWASVWASVRAPVRTSIKASIFGQHDASWLAFYDFFNLVLGLTKETKKLHGLWELAKHCGWALPHKNICWLSERHNVLKRDENGRLHNEDGAAIEYPDGWKIYAIHGTRIPGWIIDTPQKISVENIESEQNLEIKRIMINKYGQDKYLINSGAQEISKDKYGILFRKEIINDEPIVMVKVVNSTKTNGEFKDYFLRVPPEIRSPHDAVAWTFNIQGKEYNPLIET